MELLTMTDEELVLLVQKGQDPAFHELMKRYIGPIYSFAKQYARTEDDAEDIVQDAFFKAWKYMSRFERDRTFKPWLYAIAKNTALDHVKRRRSSSFSELAGDDTDLSFEDSLEDETPKPDEDYERNEIAREVSEVVKELPSDHRAVIDMHYREELTFNEIADIMRRPMNTVKSWHRRALKRVKDILAHKQ